MGAAKKWPSRNCDKSRIGRLDFSPMKRAFQIRDRRDSEKVVAQPETHGSTVPILLRGLEPLLDSEVGIEQIAEFGLEREVVPKTPAEHEIEFAGALFLLVRSPEHANFDDALADKVVEHGRLYAALGIVVAGLKIDDQRRLPL